VPELLQDIVVTIVAAGAAGIIIRRVTGVVRSPKGGALPCANCPSARRATQSKVPATSPDVKPLTLVRPSTALRAGNSASLRAGR
jgi:hypothetical protein